MQIEPYRLKNTLVLAPMAGVTDPAFRQLCRKLAAGLVVSEMVTSNPKLFYTRKTQPRLSYHSEPAPCSVRIAGADPKQMAVAAKFNVYHGVQIIDINMGCSAKKVCSVITGSALLRDELLVALILDAVNVPVSLKIGIGWDRENRNALSIVRLAENAGIQALTVHGCSRACGFKGMAEYDAVAEINTNVASSLLPTVIIPRRNRCNAFWQKRVLMRL